VDAARGTTLQSRFTVVFNLFSPLPAFTGGPLSPRGGKAPKYRAPAPSNICASDPRYFSRGPGKRGNRCEIDSG
jgi:hypothetical protein